VKPGHEARGEGVKLRTYQVGSLPIINHFLNRMKLEELLRQHLPTDDPRVELPTARAVLVLVRNILVSREPIYGIGDWSTHFAPDLLDLYDDELPLVQDDRLGRCLDRMFDGAGREFILAVVRHVIHEFQVSLDELHNDSTTVSFHGSYDEAKEEGTQRGRATPAITWGHSKDHRPDLKQLLYTLTVTEDGGVPVYFTSSSGNVVDDETHRDTWDLLRQLIGRADFLYVADCKLASRENLRHIAQRGGRFVTVLPATHKEDNQFRQRLRENPAAIRWVELYQVKDDEEVVLDTMSVCKEEMLSKDGYRLFWYRSTRKKELDRVARLRRLERAVNELRQLNLRLIGPRTRFRERTKVEAAVQKILDEYQVESLMAIEITEHTQETYKQATRGRPNSQTKYVRKARPGYFVRGEANPDAVFKAEEEDGVFPLLSNDPRFTAEDVLRAYKRQPLIEKRFSQFKNDFTVAPIYLKNVARVQGLLAVYFLVLLIQTLLERELRRALQASPEEFLPLYPESRPCRRPTTRRVLDAFESVQRHVLVLADGVEQTMVTQLTSLQRQVLSLLKLTPDDYGL
jgi:transposase